MKGSDRPKRNANLVRYITKLPSAMHHFYPALNYKMNLKKSIIVLNKFPNQKRETRVYLVDSTYTESLDLSELDLDYLQEIIHKLEILINQNDSNEYFDWGADLFSVISNCQISKCRNDIEGIELENINTVSLLFFVRELEKFKRKYSKPGVLKNIIGKAFEMIKNNPSDFKKWDHGSHYETQIDDVLIDLNLSEIDFESSVLEFLNDINEKLD